MAFHLPQTFCYIHCCARGFDLRCIYLISPRSYTVHLKPSGNFDFLRTWLVCKYAQEVRFAILVSANVLCWSWIKRNFQKIQQLETLLEHHVATTCWTSLHLHFLKIFFKRLLPGAKIWNYSYHRGDSKLFSDWHADLNNELKVN